LYELQSTAPQLRRTALGGAPDIQMNAHYRTHCFLLAVVVACRPHAAPATDQRSEPLVRSAEQLYDAYVRDVRAGRRGSIARYYDARGALIVVGGHRRYYSRAAIDSFYRGPWQAPAFFAWDTLAFDSLAPGLVVVTGQFRWLRRGTADTARFIYAAVVQRADSGMVIRMEHETPAPPPPK